MQTKVTGSKAITTKAHINTLLRTDETWEAYQDRPKASEHECFLCDMETIEMCRYWFICENQFPYDAVASLHHMLVPIEHVSRETELSPAARRELELIFMQLNDRDTYDCIMRNFTVGQSHPTHLHYHLITWKRVWAHPPISWLRK